MDNEKYEPEFGHKNVANIIKEIELEKRKIEKTIFENLHLLTELRCKHFSMRELEKVMKKKHSEMTGKPYQEIRF